VVEAKERSLRVKPTGWVVAPPPRAMSEIAVTQSQRPWSAPLPHKEHVRPRFSVIDLFVNCSDICDAVLCGGR